MSRSRIGQKIERLGLVELWEDLALKLKCLRLVSYGLVYISDILIYCPQAARAKQYWPIRWASNKVIYLIYWYSTATQEYQSTVTFPLQQVVFDSKKILAVSNRFNGSESSEVATCDLRTTFTGSRRSATAVEGSGSWDTRRRSSPS